MNTEEMKKGAREEIIETLEGYAFTLAEAVEVLGPVTAGLFMANDLSPEKQRHAFEQYIEILRAIVGVEKT